MIPESLESNVPEALTEGVVLTISGFATKFGCTLTVITADEQLTGAPLHNI